MDEWEEVSNELIDRLKRQGLSEYQAVQRAQELIDQHWRPGMDATDVLAAITANPPPPPSRSRTSTPPPAPQEDVRRSRVSTDAGPSARSRQERSAHERVLDRLLFEVEQAMAYPTVQPGEPASFLDERILTDRGSRTRGRRETLSDETSGLVAGRGRYGDALEVGQQRNGRPTFTTPRAAIAALYRLDEDDLIRLQRQLFDGGFYGDGRPGWGVLGQADKDAYIAFFSFMQDHSSLTVEEAMRAAIERNVSQLGAGVSADAGQGEFGSAAPLFVVEHSDPDTLRLTIDAVGQRILGANVDPEVREQILADLLAKEESEQRRLFELENRDALADASAVASGLREPGDPPEPELLRFMTALSGQESGGDDNAVNPRTGAHGRFQIMPGNWPTWARRAGLPADAPRTAENQERVARRILSDYYRQFGNWRDVAIAWYAGPGAAAAPSSRDRNRRQGAGNEPSINQYADQVMGRFQTGTGDIVAGAGGYETAEVTNESLDDSVEMELRRRDPTGYTATQYATQAREFMGLIGGPV